MVNRQKYSKSSQVTKRPFDPEAWEADMKLLESAPEVPILPKEAFTRICGGQGCPLHKMSYL